MAVYAKGSKFMASVGAGESRVRKTFNTEADALAWEESQGAVREAEKALAEPAPPVSAGPGLLDARKGVLQMRAACVDDRRRKRGRSAQCQCSA